MLVLKPINSKGVCMPASFLARYSSGSASSSRLAQALHQARA